jgi:hypothetical protein
VRTSGSNRDGPQDAPQERALCIAVLLSYGSTRMSSNAPAPARGRFKIDMLTSSSHIVSALIHHGSSGTGKYEQEAVSTSPSIVSYTYK